jgi:kumamolisin
LYNFPTGLDGSGQTIAIIELNTTNKAGKLGTGFDTGDLTAYFKKLKIPLPDVTAVSVDKGANLPNIDPDSDGEVMLDIEVAGAIAPKAKIAVYFAPNTDKGFIDAISAAVHDNVRKPSVVSISWGGVEDPPYTTAQSRAATNKILQDAAALGVTVCCASGDDGSADLPLTDDQGNPLRDGKAHVDFPSSSPFALACGGTRLLSGANGAPVDSVWNDGDSGPNGSSGSGGGGVSNYFDKPDYQSGVNVPKSPKGKSGRGVPDVSGDADPVTGYVVRVGGKKQTYGGTSAVAPLWAGLVALINQRLAANGKPPCGFINPILYQSPAALRDVTVGDNDIDGTLGKYQASSGWDACSGLGTPDGTRVMKLLGG